MPDEVGEEVDAHGVLRRKAGAAAGRAETRFSCEKGRKSGPSKDMRENLCDSPAFMLAYAYEDGDRDHNDDDAYGYDTYNDEDEAEASKENQALRLEDLYEEICNAEDPCAFRNHNENDDKDDRVLSNIGNTQEDKFEDQENNRFQHFHPRRQQQQFKVHVLGTHATTAKNESNKGKDYQHGHHEEEEENNDDDGEDGENELDEAATLAQPASALSSCPIVPKRDELRDRLASMLETERKYQVQDNYIESVQVDGMRPVWRSRLFEWMFEFVDEYDIGICTVATAMNYVDRYLSHVSTKKCILQLVALAAILVATKLCETQPISIKELQGLAEGIYLESDIRLMELELLRVLSWELNPVTPFAFLRHLILYFDSVDRKLREKVLSFTETFLEIVLCEYIFVQFLPSETATASLLCALDICNCRCTALGTSLGAVHPGRVAHCKTTLLKYVREVFPEYFRSEEVVSPDCVADLGFSDASVTPLASPTSSFTSSLSPAACNIKTHF